MCYITPLDTLLSFPPRALIWYSDAGISSPALTMGKFITGKWEHQVAICNLSNLSRVFQSLTMETKLPINILKLCTVKMALPQLWTTNPLRRHQESYSFEGSKSIHLMDRDLLSNLFGPYPVGGQLESRLPRWSQIKGNGALQADISEMEDPGCGYPGLWFNKLPLFVARTKDFLALTLDALIIHWSQFRLIVAFPLVWVLPCLLHKTAQKTSPEEPGMQTYSNYYETTPGLSPKGPLSSVTCFKGMAVATQVLGSRTLSFLPC